MATRCARRSIREMVSASMGIYVFNTEVLLRLLQEDAQNPASAHDFGKDVIPAALDKARVIAYDFRDINGKQARYWRDVGTIDAFYEANMDLVAVSPEFNLYDRNWPIRTRVVQAPPAKFVFAQEGRRMGVAVDSIVAAGCIVSGGRVVRSVLSTGRARQQLLRGGVFDSDAQRQDRAQQPHPARHCRYRRGDSRIERDRLRRRRGPRPRLHRHGFRNRGGAGQRIPVGTRCRPAWRPVRGGIAKARETAGAQYWYHGLDEISATLAFLNARGLSAGADTASFATCVPCPGRESARQAAGHAHAASCSTCPSGSSGNSGPHYWG